VDQNGLVRDILVQSRRANGPPNGSCASC
jgi:hypothetical protein